MLCFAAGLAALVAVIVTAELAGIVDGAAYSPSAAISPTAVFPPATPLTVHSTAVFAVPVTFAVYCDRAPSVTPVAPLSAKVTVGC
jgi:hypothetical protein